MNINQPYNGIKCCPVCATNLETIWMALKMAMPLSARPEPPPAAKLTPPAVNKPRKASPPPRTIITPEQKEHAQRLKAQGVSAEEISRLTGIKKNSLAKIIFGAEALAKIAAIQNSKPSAA